jgi:hypothetical protein
MSGESSVEGDVQEGICHESEIDVIWKEAGLGSSSSSEDNDKSSDDDDDSSFSSPVVDESPHTGQTTHRVARIPRLVTNGFGFNQKTSKCVFLVKKITPDNQTALALHEFSPPFILLCAAWAERGKPHFFHESAHVVQSTADEVGIVGFRNSTKVVERWLFVLRYRRFPTKKVTFEVSQSLDESYQTPLSGLPVSAIQQRSLNVGFMC